MSAERKDESVERNDSDVEENKENEIESKDDNSREEIGDSHANDSEQKEDIEETPTEKEEEGKDISEHKEEGDIDEKKDTSSERVAEAKSEAKPEEETKETTDENLSKAEKAKKAKEEKAEKAKKEKEEKAEKAKKAKEEKEEKAKKAKEEKEEKAQKAKEEKEAKLKKTMENKEKIKAGKLKEKEEKAEKARKAKEEKAEKAKKLKEEKDEKARRKKMDREEKEAKRKKDKAERAPSNKKGGCCHKPATQVKEKKCASLNFTMLLPQLTPESFEQEQQNEFRFWVIRSLLGEINETHKLVVTFDNIRAGSLIIDVMVDGIDDVDQAHSMTTTLMEHLKRDCQALDIFEGCKLQGSPVVIDSEGIKYSTDAQVIVEEEKTPIVEEEKTPIVEDSTPIVETPLDPSPNAQNNDDTSKLQSELKTLSLAVEEKRAELLKLEEAAKKARKAELASLDNMASLTNPKDTSPVNMHEVRESLLNQSMDPPQYNVNNASISVLDLESPSKVHRHHKQHVPSDGWQTHFDTGEMETPSRHRHHRDMLRHRRKRSVPSAVPAPPPFESRNTFNQPLAIAYPTSPTSSSPNIATSKFTGTNRESRLWSQLENMIAECEKGTLGHSPYGIPHSAFPIHGQSNTSLSRRESRRQL